MWSIAWVTVSMAQPSAESSIWCSGSFEDAGCEGGDHLGSSCDEVVDVSGDWSGVERVESGASAGGRV